MRPHLLHEQQPGDPELLAPVRRRLPIHEPLAQPHVAPDRLHHPEAQPVVRPADTERRDLVLDAPVGLRNRYALTKTNEKIKCTGCSQLTTPSLCSSSASVSRVQGREGCRQSAPACTTRIPAVSSAFILYHFLKNFIGPRVSARFFGGRGRVFKARRARSASRPLKWTNLFMLR